MYSQTERLAGKVAIVTGASSGFGRGIVLAYAAQGAKVVVSDVHEQPNQGGFEDKPQLTTVAAIKEAGGQAHYVSCDVTKQDQVAYLVADTVKVFGALDVMVNNAGIYRAGKLAHEFGVEDLDACWDVNVKSSWFGCQEAIKVFLQQGRGGNIANIVSTAGLQGHPKQSVYNISKGAAANMTRCLAIEYGQNNIRVNGICPTYVKTSLTRALFDDKDFDKTFTDMIPLKRWGEVDDIASLAVLPASDESSYIHGDLDPHRRRRNPLPLLGVTKNARAAPPFGPAPCAVQASVAGRRDDPLQAAACRAHRHPGRRSQPDHRVRADRPVGHRRQRDRACRADRPLGRTADRGVLLAGQRGLATVRAVVDHPHGRERFLALQPRAAWHGTRVDGHRHRLGFRLDHGQGRVLDRAGCRLAVPDRRNHLLLVAFFSFTGENWIVAGMALHRKFGLLLVLIAGLTYVINSSAIRWTPAWWFPFVQLGLSTALFPFLTRGMKQPGKSLAQMCILALVVLACTSLSSLLGIWSFITSPVSPFWSSGTYSADNLWLLFFMVGCSINCGLPVTMAMARMVGMRVFQHERGPLLRLHGRQLVHRPDPRLRPRLGTPVPVGGPAR